MLSKKALTKQATQLRIRTPMKEFIKDLIRATLITLEGNKFARFNMWLIVILICVLLADKCS